MPLYGAREEWRRSFSPCFFDFLLAFLFICSQSGNGLNWFCLLFSIGTFLLAFFISDEKDNDRLFRAVFYSRHSFGFDYLTTYQRGVSKAPNHTLQTAVWFPVGSTIPYYTFCNSIYQWFCFPLGKMGETCIIIKKGIGNWFLSLNNNEVYKWFFYLLHFSFLFLHYCIRSFDKLFLDSGLFSEGCLLAHHVRPADVDHSGSTTGKLASVQNPIEVIDPGERGWSVPRIGQVILDSINLDVGGSIGGSVCHFDSPESHHWDSIVIPSKTFSVCFCCFMLVFRTLGLVLLFCTHFDW